MAVLLDIFGKLKTAFDEANLAVAGYHVIRFWRIGSSPIRRIDDTWSLSVEYSGELEQTA